MPHSSNIVSFIHHLRIAYEYLDDFTRQHPTSIGTRKFSEYMKKIEWMKNDLITQPAFRDSPETILGIKEEWNSDVFAIPAIMDKVAKIPPEAREILEEVIDELLKGEKLKVEYIKDESAATV